MKSLIRIFGLFILGTAFLMFLDSCSRSIYFNVLRPADLTLSENIKTISVGNRSFPDPKNPAGNIIEGIFTGEGIGEDRAASDACVNAVYNKLASSPRFSLNYAVSEPLYGTGTANWPEALSPDKVKQICAKSQSQALLLLEAFDSNSGTTFGTRTNNVRDKNGVITKVIVQTATCRMSITHAWTLYDGNSGLIIDRFRGEDFMTFSGSGPTQLDAMRQIIPKPEAMRQTAEHAGRNYALRIAPVYVTVYRSYYSGGNPELKRASRFVRVNNWDGAMDIWDRMPRNWDPKIAGKAVYNMALGYEVKGFLEKALSTAQKAYTDFGNRRAADYVGILQNRINN